MGDTFKVNGGITIGNLLSILATAGATALILYQVGVSYGTLTARQDELFRRVEKFDQDRKDGDALTLGEIRAMQERLDRVFRYFQIPANRGDITEPEPSKSALQGG